MVMFEFEVMLKSKERVFLFGYNYQDAINRSKLSANEIDFLLHQEYVD